MYAGKLIPAVALALAVAGSAHATGIVRVTEAAFSAEPGVIGFDEFPLGTFNPEYAPATYGGGPGAPTVTFDGYFAGQALTADCPVAGLSACVGGAASGPLALAAAAPDTRTFDDSPTNPRVLVAGSTLRGPIAMLFSLPQVAVGFDAGFFDAVGSTRVQAFATDGTLLGTLLNEAAGSITQPTEFFGLVTDDGSPAIAGLLLDLVAEEPFGFAVDNLRFGSIATVPAPLTAVLLFCGLLLVSVNRGAQPRSVAA